MDTNGVLISTTTATTIFGVIVMVYKAINHKRCRSTCCGQKMEMSVDVEQTTPPNERFQVNNPVAVQRPTEIVIPKS